MYSRSLLSPLPELSFVPNVSVWNVSLVLVCVWWASAERRVCRMTNDEESTICVVKTSNVWGNWATTRKPGNESNFLQ